jgi:hypothetical protein
MTGKLSSRERLLKAINRKEVNLLKQVPKSVANLNDHFPIGNPLKRRLFA